MNEKKRVVGYYKIHDGEQSAVDQAIEIQKDYMENEVARHTDWELKEIYIDIVKSNDPKERKELHRMIEDCRSGKVDIIITKSISRLSRDTVEALRTIKEMTEIGVEIITESGIIDTKSELGKAMMNMLESMEK